MSSSVITIHPDNVQAAALYIDSGLHNVLLFVTTKFRGFITFAATVRIAKQLANSIVDRQLEHGMVDKQWIEQQVIKFLGKEYRDARAEVRRRAGLHGPLIDMHETYEAWQFAPVPMTMEEKTILAQTVVSYAEPHVIFNKGEERRTTALQDGLCEAKKAFTHLLKAANNKTLTSTSTHDIYVAVVDRLEHRTMRESKPFETWKIKLYMEALFRYEQLKQQRERRNAAPGTSAANALLLKNSLKLSKKAAGKETVHGQVHGQVNSNSASAAAANTSIKPVESSASLIKQAEALIGYAGVGRTVLRIHKAAQTLTAGDKFKHTPGSILTLAAKAAQDELVQRIVSTKAETDEDTVNTTVLKHFEAVDEKDRRETHLMHLRTWAFRRIEHIRTKVLDIHLPYSELTRLVDAAVNKAVASGQPFYPKEAIERDVDELVRLERIRLAQPAASASAAAAVQSPLGFRVSMRG